MTTDPALTATAIGGRVGGEFGRRVRAYVRLTKPRVVELLLVTTVPAMVVAARGWPHTGLVVAVVIAGALAAGGANTINSWIERDRDRLMHRTAQRPLVTGEIPAWHGLAFGIGLNVIAFAVLSLTANVLAALLTLSATLFYVFVYTIWLKPRTDQNIVIGGAAGAVPVLVGFAAVSDHVPAAAWVLFAVIFCWTPAHFWALAMRYRDDYATAGYPMLPVHKSGRTTALQITTYAALTTVVTLLLGTATTVGPVYIVSAALLGVVFIVRALALVRDPNSRRAIKFFAWSNIYLMLVFAALMVDVFVRN
ncbi:MAG TPA: heme o synthase [Acidimicrobiia bacterium]